MSKGCDVDFLVVLTVHGFDINERMYALMKDEFLERK